MKEIGSYQYFAPDRGGGNGNGLDPFLKARIEQSSDPNMQANLRAIYKGLYGRSLTPLLLAERMGEPVRRVNESLRSEGVDVRSPRPNISLGVASYVVYSDKFNSRATPDDLKTARKVIKHDLPLFIDEKEAEQRQHRKR